MKSLYDKNYRYTSEASSISNSTHELMKPIFDKYTSLGFSPREISKIMQESIIDIELETILSIKENK